jgi:hypothetical protein
VSNWQGWLSAIGSAVALAGLGVALYELRAGRAERRDNQASQARLITIEQRETNNPSFFYAAVYNHSEAPVFDLRLVRIGYIERTTENRIRPLFPDVEFLGTRHTPLFKLFRPCELLPLRVLSPGASTDDNLLWANVEWSDPDKADHSEAKQAAEIAMTVSYTDSHGRRWERTNTKHPVRVLDPPEGPWWRRERPIRGE